MSLELFVRGLYTRTAVARHPCFSWAFLFKNETELSLMHRRCQGEGNGPSRLQWVSGAHRKLPQCGPGQSLSQPCFGTFWA